MIVVKKFSFTIFKNCLKVNRLAQLCVLIELSETLETIVRDALRSPNVVSNRSRIINRLPGLKFFFQRLVAPGVFCSYLILQSLTVLGKVRVVNVPGT